MYIKNELKISLTNSHSIECTSIPTITDRSARLNPRSVSKAGAVNLPYLPPEIHSLPSRHRRSNPAESERHDAAGAAKYIRTLVRGLREATRAREKSWYTKINIGDPTMSPNGARVFVSARPSITPRIRRQTCNARSCRLSPPSPFSDPLATLLVHIQTEDNEKSLSEYILGRGYLGRFFFKTHLFRAITRVAQS